MGAQSPHAARLSKSIMDDATSRETKITLHWDHVDATQMNDVFWIVSQFSSQT